AGCREGRGQRAARQRAAVLQPRYRHKTTDAHRPQSDADHPWQPWAAVRIETVRPIPQPAPRADAPTLFHWRGAQTAALLASRYRGWTERTHSRVLLASARYFLSAILAMQEPRPVAREPQMALAKRVRPAA